jgi:hypothetical protein
MADHALKYKVQVGTSDDYAFSRHFMNQHKGKIYSYTIEWGSPSNLMPFHPPNSEMQKIIVSSQTNRSRCDELPAKWLGLAAH